MRSLVTRREVDHLVGSAMVSGAGMDEDTGDVADFSSSLTRTSKHGVLDRPGRATWKGSQLIVKVMTQHPGRAQASGILNNRR